MAPPGSKKTRSIKGSLTYDERCDLADMKEQRRILQKENREAKMAKTKERHLMRYQKQNEALKNKTDQPPAQAGESPQEQQPPAQAGEV